MGTLLDALTPPSSYAAKKGTAWPDLLDRIGSCMMLAELDAFTEWLELFPLSYPAAWLEPLLDEVERQKELIEAEDERIALRST